MTPTSFVATIDVTLRQYADAQIAFDMRAYLLNQFEFLGIRAPVRRQVQAGVLDAQRISDDWIEHSDFWVRRCAMLHQLGWRLGTDTSRLFRYSEQLASEDEFFIRKAIGWALRDYARWNPTAVQNFIEKKQGVFSGLTVREATKHLK